MSQLDHHLITEIPSPVYMGELPRSYGQIPAKVVVNLCGAFPYGSAHGKVVFCLAMLDALDPGLMPDRRTFESFLSSVHQVAKDEPTYWHCHAGINRSGLALAAYLHIYRDLKISESIGLLRTKRSEMVLCNHLFERRLREWYGGDDEQQFEPVDLDVYTLGLRPSD